MIHQDILSALGQTPLVAIKRLNPNPAVRLAAKLESKNPGGSIKDRVACAMIEAAEAQGALTPGKTVIEATSGNTGIGLAMVCAVKGYPLRLIMPESASEERKRVMRAYGAQIVLTPGHLGTDGAIEEAYRLAREEPEKYVLMDQFNNPASIEAHYKGTAQEIWDQAGPELSHVVATLGTSGTVMGLIKRLKELNPAVQVVAVEPFPGHKIQGLKNMQESYPPGIYNKKSIDRILMVEDEEAFESARQLARFEGMCVGMSSGAAMAGALRLAKELESGLVVVIFPDSGERYLSTTLFAAPESRGVGILSLSGQTKVHPFAPGSESGLFTPGPNLDAPADLEAWRRVVLLDSLRAYLEAGGVKAGLCVGLADSDDRSMNAAREAGLGRAEFAEAALGEVKRLAALLRVAPDTGFTLASRSLEKGLTLCRKLLSKGLAYEKLRSVYFDVSRDARYGSLLGTDLSKLSLGKTVDLAAYLKDNPMDFTLLKRASLQDLKKGEVCQTEWGNVRPSWLLQMAGAALCGLSRLGAVMADEAHSFPQLENLRALWSLGGSGEPAAWLLCGGVQCRPGQCPDLAALAAENPLALRMWLLSTAYRKTLSYSENALRMWRKNQRRLSDVAALLAVRAGEGGAAGAKASDLASRLEDDFSSAFEDDLALHRFWPALFSFCRQVNAGLASQEFGPACAARLLEALRKCSGVLKFLDDSALPLSPSAWPGELAGLISEREAARAAKDFAAADRIRLEAAELGYRLEDAPEGLRVYLKS